jgi:RNA polymerase sigma factor (sigma-70 family)
MLAYDTLRKNYRWQRGKDLSQAWYFEPESPEQQIIDRLEARGRMKLFGRRERSIVYWRIWRDLPFAEIAERMELKVDNVKRIYQRAIKKLAKEVASGPI